MPNSTHSKLQDFFASESSEITKEEYALLLSNDREAYAAFIDLWNDTPIRLCNANEYAAQLQRRLTEEE